MEDERALSDTPALRPGLIVGVACGRAGRRRRRRQRRTCAPGCRSSRGRSCAGPSRDAALAPGVHRARVRRGRRRRSSTNCTEAPGQGVVLPDGRLPRQPASSSRWSAASWRGPLPRPPLGQAPPLLRLEPRQEDAGLAGGLRRPTCRPIWTRSPAFGVDRPRYFLPPYEHYNADIARWTAELGLTLVNFTPGTRSNADYTRGRGEELRLVAGDLREHRAPRAAEPHGLSGFLLLLHIGAGPKRTDKFHARFGELLDHSRREGLSVRARGQAAGTGAEAMSKRAISPVGCHPCGTRATRMVCLCGVAGRTPAAGDMFVRASQVGYGRASRRSAWPSPMPRAGSVRRGRRRDPVRRSPRGQGRALPGSAGANSPPRRTRLHGASRGPAATVLQVGHGAVAAVHDRRRRAGRSCPTSCWSSCASSAAATTRCSTRCHQFDGRTAYGPLPAGTPSTHAAAGTMRATSSSTCITSSNATAQMLLAYAAGVRPDGRAIADRVDALGQPGANGVPTSSTRRAGASSGCCGCIPRPISSITRSPTTAITTAGGCRRTKRPTTAGARAASASSTSPTAQPQGLSKYKSESTGVANLAGRYAAAMALAYQIWKDDPHAARRSPSAACRPAREVYALGRAKEGVQQGNSYRRPYRYDGDHLGRRHGMGRGRAVSRPRASARYLEDAHALRAAGRRGDVAGWASEQAGHYQYYPFMNVGHFRLHDWWMRDFQAKLAGYYREEIERCAQRAPTAIRIASACRSSGARTISSSRWRRSAASTSG